MINVHRVWAIMQRHLFSWPRDLETLAEAFWWPTFDLFIWGLMSVFLRQKEGVPAGFLSIFLGAIVLWMFVYRSQQEIGFIFLKEVWDRNFLNLLTTPLTIWEFLAASLALGTVRLVISAVWMAVIGYLLFTFNLFRMGWFLIPFVINLLMIGWSAGFFINGIILQYGNRVQSFAWTLILIIQPFSAVFYPVSAMPGWMQIVSRILPTSYVFEGMRGVLLDGRMDVPSLGIATGLNLVYLGFSLWYFRYSFERAKKTGMLVKFS